jgi:uncharacterized protein (DUF1697 family)
MTSYIALLHAVNVGGTGKLPMTELKALCDGLGFIGARTYIASGNVVFKSDKSAQQVKAALEQALEGHMGKAVGVQIRTQSEMQAVLDANPFPGREGSRTLTLFVNSPPSADTPNTATGQGNEEIILGAREVYIYYPDGMGRSKLRLPIIKTGTARNINTVAKLAAMAADL